MVKFAAVAILFGTFSLASAEALAQRSSGGGYCPPGTCAQNGGPRAAELRHCKKENCKGATTAPKGQTKNSRAQSQQRAQLPRA